MILYYHYRLHIMAGVASAERPACPRVYVSNLRLAADLLAKEDIVGVIEPLSIKPGYFLNSFQQGQGLKSLVILLKTRK